MTRNLKALGVIAAAALMMSAVFASAAQATAKQFKAGATSGTHTASTLHGLQEGTEADNFFQIEHPTGSKITCTNSGVTFAGSTATGTDSVLTMTPTYKECWQVGTTRNVTVNMNECDYTFTQPTEIAKNEFTGTADLYCPHGSVINVTIFSADGVEAHKGAHGGFKLCELTIRPVVGANNTETATEQTLGGHVIYKNVEKFEVTPQVEKDIVTANATIEGIFWEKSGLCGSGSGHDGTYRNLVRVTGSAGEEKHHDVWVG